MYVRTVLYVQYLIFLKTRKISEDLPICYRIRAVHGSRPFRAGPKPYRRASGTWQNPYSQRFCSKVLAKILQSAWLWRLPGASLAGRPLSARLSPSKAIGRNSQKSGIPTEILKISVFGLSCVRAIVYASVIRSAPQKSPPPFLDFTTPFTTPFFRGPWPSMETSLQADRKIRGTGFLSKTRELG